MAKIPRDQSANSGADHPNGSGQRKAARPRKAASAPPPAAPLPPPVTALVVVEGPACDAGEAGSERDWCDLVGDVNELVESTVNGISIVDFCRERGITIARLFYWLEAEPERKKRYVASRALRADVLVDEMIGIVDETATVVNVPLFDENGQPMFHANGGQLTRSFAIPLCPDVIARNRLRFDARRWAASKMQPKTYGDKITAEHSGPNGGAMQVQTTQTLDLRGLSGEELQTMELLLAKTVAQEPAQP